MFFKVKSNYFTKTYYLNKKLNLFDLSLHLNGFPIGKAQQVLKEIQNKSELEYENYLFSKKSEIVNYHFKHSPFFRQLVNSSDINNWESLPILTKRHLQKPLEDRLSKHYSLKGVYVNKTSGSSGDPFIFAKDKFCHALTWAVIKNRFSWFDLDFNTSKQARFYGIPLNKKDYYKERIKDKLSNRYRFSVFDLSDLALEKCLKIFKTTKFDYINGYTSPIVQFAKFLERKNLSLKTICPSLKTCIVTSEMLFDDDKALMENQFGVPVVNEYGASELDLIAFQNTKNEWLINSETLYVEIVDEKNNILPYGEEGRIIITSLYNKAHPFIRYDIGDLGILSKQSTLKKPILEKLSGRTNDIIVLPSGKKAAGLTFYYITKSIIEDKSNIKEFVIEQQNVNTFKIIYTSQKNISKEKIKIIKTEIGNYLETGLIINFERLDKISRSKSGKLKQFSTLLKNTAR